MEFADAVKSGFKNLSNFSGRASRSEFWWWFLFVALLNLGLLWVSMVLLNISGNHSADDFARQVKYMSLLTTLVNLLFNGLLLSVQIRRLHDVNQSGGFALAYFIPVLGSLVFSIVSLISGNEAPHINLLWRVHNILGYVLTILLVFMFVWNCRRGTAGPNRFGADPLLQNL